MIIKTNEQRNGKYLYLNVLTGQKDVLARMQFYPSRRKKKRHPTLVTEPVTTNRKKTRGRNVIYQFIQGLDERLRSAGKEVKQELKPIEVTVKNKETRVYEKKTVFVPVHTIFHRLRRGKVIKQIQK